jgi:predicted permease
MSWIKGFTARARSILAARAAESRMNEELRFHVDMETDRLMATGISETEARRRAMITFGGMEACREEMRDGRGARWLADLLADLRYALRAMRKSPGFAIAVAVTLGVGIGVNGIVFGFVNGLLLRPVPAREPRQLVGLFYIDTKSGHAGELAFRDFVDFRDASGIFDGLAQMTGVPINLVANVSPGAAPATTDMVWGEMVTENFFSVLGMQPTLGRFFATTDAAPGANPFAVLSEESWRRRFRGDPDVVGRVVRINGHPFTIVAVAPPGFKGMRQFGFRPELWVPVGMHDVVLPGSATMLEGRGSGGWMMAFGRMREGWSIERTASAASLFAKRLEATYPQSNRETGAIVIPAAAGFDNPSFFKPTTIRLSSLLGIFSSLVTLLIICANLANLQFARVSSRGREIGIRLALGCSRERLMRQMVAESLLFAMPGAMLAFGVLSLSPAIESRLVPRLQFQMGLNAHPDGRVIAFTAAVSLFAAILFGLIPALRATRRNIAPALVSVIGERRPTLRAPGLRAVLVVSQLAASVVLLVGAVLFARSFANARASDVGFDPSNRLVASVELGLQGYDERRGQQFYETVITRVRTLPDVISATWGSPAPFDTMYEDRISVWVESAPTDSKIGTVSVPVSTVAEDFVGAMGLRLEAGREFAANDAAGRPDVMVVSRSLATRLWPGRNAVGEYVRVGGATGRQVAVIGVVGDAKFGAFGPTTEAHAYLPVRQRYGGRQTLVVHTRVDPSTLLPQLRAVVAAVNPMLPLFNTMTLDQSVENGLNPSMVAAVVAGFFAALALLIAAVGLSAVVAHSVAERTREIGVRLALGSTPIGVVRLVMRGSVRLGAWGLAIGLLASTAVARVLGGLLYGVSPADPVTFAVVPIALAMVVLMATYLPTRRAIRLDPVTALRNE